MHSQLERTVQPILLRQPRPLIPQHFIRFWAICTVWALASLPLASTNLSRHNSRLAIDIHISSC